MKTLIHKGKNNYHNKLVRDLTDVKELKQEEIELKLVVTETTTEKLLYSAMPHLVFT